MDFHKVEIEDLVKLDTIFKRQPYRICDYTINTIYAWRDFYHYECAYVGDGVIFRYIDDGKTVYSFPLVFETNPKEIIAKLPSKARFAMVPIENVEFLKANYQISYELDRDFCDYLYDIDSLATYKGKKNNKLRNHVNKFLSIYQDKLVLSEINSNDISDILLFLDKYEDKTIEDKSYHYDLAKCREIFRNYQIFKKYYIGFKVVIDGVLAGIVLGSVILDTAYMHIEKALKDYDGIYPYLTKVFSSEIQKRFSEVKYINREEDVGNEGLRKSKLAHHPLRLVEKYNVVML